MLPSEKLCQSLKHSALFLRTFHFPQCHSQSACDLASDNKGTEISGSPALGRRERETGPSHTVMEKKEAAGLCVGRSPPRDGGGGHVLKGPCGCG